MLLTRIVEHRPCPPPAPFHTFSAAAAAGAKSHPYSHWIRTYSAPAYLRMPAVKERIINQLGTGVPYGEDDAGRDNIHQTMIMHQ